MKRYTAHAEQRLKERGISKVDVEHACNHAYGSPAPGSTPGSIAIVGPLPGTGKRLKVVLNSSDPDLVITAYVLQ